MASEPADRSRYSHGRRLVVAVSESGEEDAQLEQDMSALDIRSALVHATAPMDGEGNHGWYAGPAAIDILNPLPVRYSAALLSLTAKITHLFGLLEA